MQDHLYITICKGRRDVYKHHAKNMHNTYISCSRAAVWIVDVTEVNPSVPNHQPNQQIIFNYKLWYNIWLRKVCAEMIQ